MKRAIQTLLAIIAIGATTARANLIAYWNFDESSGTTAADVTGLFNGTLSGGAVFVPGGIEGNAISLGAASNSLVNMGPGFPGFTTGDFSIVAWIKTTTVTGSAIAAKHESGSDEGYFLQVNADITGNGALGKAAFYDSYSNGRPTSTTTVNDGLWHLVVGVYHAGGAAEIFVDGSLVEDSRTSHTINANSAPFLIGGVDVSGVPTASYTGLVDDVQVYGNALSSGDVQYLFNNPGSAIPEPTTYTAFAGLGALAFAAYRRRRRLVDWVGLL